MRNKIAFISEHASPLALLGNTDNGGQNVYVAELAIKLAEKGYDIDIFTRRDDTQAPQINEFAPGVRVVLVNAGPQMPLPKEDLLPFMKEFRHEMERFIQQHKIQYHLIHANFWMSGLVAMQLKEIHHIPFVITFHALGHVRKIHQKEQDRFPPERVAIEKEIVKQANRIIAECPQDKNDLIAYYQADETKISIIPCGFNPQDFYPVGKQTAKALLDFAADEKIILQLGRMVPRKGIDNVISAFAKLKLSDINARLVVVGGEGDDNHPELLRLKALANKFGVANSVNFVGRKDRAILRYYYSAADLFVTTPWYEPFGITPLEAMACATPVIGANVGGIKHTVKHAETGLLVEPNQADELANAMQLLLTDEDLLESMRAKALDHVHANFTWEKVAEQMSICYEGIYHKRLLVHQEEIELIKKACNDAADTIQKTAATLSMKIAEAGELMSRALLAGNKILVCGNGGSAAESQHFAAELVGRFEIPNRPGLPALSLNADMAILTAWANDFSYSDVFARQVQAFGCEGDILLYISTSGNSDNILNAIQMAHQKNMLCIGMLGKDGGKAAAMGDVNLVVPSQSTQRIQEVHLQMVHLLCTLIENKVFGQVNLPQTNIKAIKMDSASTYNQVIGTVAKTSYGS